MAIDITPEMWSRARIESQRRNDYIRHHFELTYMSGTQRDEIGFIGEFACKVALGIDWKNDIRENYEVIDSGDIITPKMTIDIKTETIPHNKLIRLLQHQISDDQAYGRRLISEGQVNLLSHYDYVVWGAVSREHKNKWFSLGYLETSYILSHYTITSKTPFGGYYPEPCLNVRHSELKPFSQLKRMLNNDIY